MDSGAFNEGQAPVKPFTPTKLTDQLMWIYKIIKAWFVNRRCSRAKFQMYHPSDKLDAEERRACNICDGYFFPPMELEDE